VHTHLRMGGILFLLVGMVYSPATAQVPVEVTLTIEDTTAHYIRIEMQIPAAGEDSLEVKMPVWIPGSYLIREYERHLIDFQAATPDGKPLRWKKVRKNTWRIYTSGNDWINLRYRIYAFDPSIRASYVDGERAFLNPSSLILFARGQVGRPYRLKLIGPSSWRKISTGLRRLPGNEWLFEARDYDELVDCPIEWGNQEVFTFEIEGISFELAVAGRGNVRPDTLVPYFERIVRATLDLMKTAPFDRYVFIVQLRRRGSGGLEHRNSCVIQTNRWSFQPGKRFLGFLGTVSHEFFHAWNVKAIRPYPLGPFDYDRENYTTLLWIAEGFTSYYGPRILLKAGLLPQTRYLQRLERAIQSYLRTPGRKVQPLAEASFDAWIKFYRPNENSQNTTISYYSKGALVALLLDLLIRHQTEGRASLDDVMRRLYEEFARAHSRAYTFQDFKSVCEQVAGVPLDEFFRRTVFSTDEIDFARYLDYAGLECTIEPVPWKEHKQPGFNWRGEGSSVRITQVLNGSPAHRAGLMAGDEWIGLDGFRVTPQNVPTLLEMLTPQTVHRFLVSRDGILKEWEAEWTGWSLPRVKIQPKENPGDLERKIYRSWIFQTS